MPVYFARYFFSPPRIKIGISGHPGKRVRSISVSEGVAYELIGTIEGGAHREREIHNSIRKFRIKGEWFRDCDEVNATIQNCFNNFALANAGKPQLISENFGKCWKALFPFKSAEELAFRIGCSKRTAEYELSGEHEPSSRAIAALINLCVPKRE